MGLPAVSITNRSPSPLEFREIGRWCELQRNETFNMFSLVSSSLITLKASPTHFYSTSSTNKGKNSHYMNDMFWGVDQVHSCLTFPLQPKPSCGWLVSSIFGTPDASLPSRTTQIQQRKPLKKIFQNSSWFGKWQQRSKPEGSSLVKTVKFFGWRLFNQMHFQLVGQIHSPQHWHCGSTKFTANIENAAFLGLTFQKWLSSPRFDITAVHLTVYYSCCCCLLKQLLFIHLRYFGKFVCF